MVEEEAGDSCCMWGCAEVNGAQTVLCGWISLRYMDGDHHICLEDTFSLVLFGGFEGMYGFMFGYLENFPDCSLVVSTEGRLRES